MIIYFFETTTEEQSIFEKTFAGFTVFCTDKKLSEETVVLAKDADIVSVFVNSSVSKSVIDLLPKLIYITTRSTGYDHIDITYAKTKKIVVSNVPAYGSATVAEFTFALLLSLSRHTAEAVSHIRSEESFDISMYKGFDLQNKTLGVIGTGRIGRHVIQIAKGFGMEVVAYDMYPNEAVATELGFIYVQYETLLERADIITLHAPYTPQNYHLLDTDAFLKMKKGVYIINTARGELIDTTELLVAIEKGIVAGAGLDVLEGERALKEGAEFICNKKMAADVSLRNILLVDHALLHHPKVIVTPHIAFDSIEAESEIIKTTIENIESFIHHTPKNLL